MSKFLDRTTTTVRRVGRFRLPLIPLLVAAFAPLAHVNGAVLGAELLERENEVAARAQGKTWQAAAVGLKLVARDKVRTGPKSRAVLAITDRTLVRLDERTIAEVGSSSYKLDEGGLYFLSRERAPEIEITTPAATGFLHGTQLVVRVTPAGKTLISVLEGRVDLSNALGRVTLLPGEQGEAEIGKRPKKTAVIVTMNLLQWALYYPAVIDPRDLGLSRAEEASVAASLSAYREGDLLGALERYPKNYHPKSAAARLYLAGVVLAVGRVDDARAALSAVPPGNAARRAIEEMIQAVNGVDADPVKPGSRPARSGALPAGQPGAIAANPRPAFRVPPVVLAVNLEIDGVTHERSTASEWLAHSYYEQSRSRLESALDAARKALELAPEFGYAAVRVAELEFAFGRTRAALRNLNLGLKFTPRNAQAHALHGFLLSAQNHTRDAKKAFEHAISLDGALGNAWLGRGLCAIRQGGALDGRHDLQVATVLEANRSLFHSYFGKAESQVGLKDAARHDLDFAKQIDPRDPTPWLYSALIDETENRPNLAISELQESIDRNDNRRLYRSGLLLDQDRAVRSANLARIYQRAGLDDVAVREATRAVDSDYTNGSAHLFLANSFDALRDPTRIQLRYETAWFNELLLANLLSPVGGGSLSQFVSQQEYSKLFEGDGTHVSSLTEWRSDGVFRENASIFGTYGNFSFALDGSQYWQGGTRPNNDLSLTEFYFNLKYQLTPDDTFLFLTKWANQRQGDLFQTSDNLPLDAAVRFKEKQEPGLLLGGWNHRWAPGVNTLFLGGRLSAEQLLKSPATTQTLVQRDALGLTPGFLTRDPNLGDSFTNPALAADPNAVTLGPDGETLSYSPAFTAGIQPYIGQGMAQSLSSDTFDFYTFRRFELTTLELQQIWQTKYNTALIGARWVEGHFETDTILTLTRPTFSGGFTTPAAAQHSETSMHQLSLYAYDYFRPAKWITLIGGVSWDHIEHPDNFRNPPVNDRERKRERVSAKAGFTLEPSRWVTLRGVYGESLGGVTFDESVRLEPVQIAGFNQAFRTVISESIAGSVEAPLYKYTGLSIEGHLPTRTWWGVSINALQEDVDRTLGV